MITPGFSLSFTPTYPNAPAESEQPACSFRRSHPQERLHRGLHRPNLNSIATNQHLISSSTFFHLNHILLREEGWELSRGVKKREKETHFVKVKHQIQLTHIPEKTIEHLDKEVNSFQIRQLIIIRVDADTKEQSRITPINNLERAEFDKVGLMLLISRRNQAMHFTLEFNFFFILKVWELEGGANVLALLYIRRELKWRGRTGADGMAILRYMGRTTSPGGFCLCGIAY